MWWGNTLKLSLSLVLFLICTFKIEWTYHNVFFYFLSLKYLLKIFIFQDFSTIKYKDKNSNYYNFKT